MKKKLIALINKAKVAAERAYAPYSGYSVGAALLSSRGTVFTGCNVENASFGLTLCAERVAIGKALSSGERDVRYLAIYGTGSDFPFPCGACLQVLAEFNPTLDIIVANEAGKVKKVNLKKLFPHQFIFKGNKNV